MAEEQRGPGTAENESVEEHDRRRTLKKFGVYGLYTAPASPAASRAQTVSGGGENRGNGPLWFWYP
jgi:hypothetical protein